MIHMYILCTEPSSVILSQKEIYKLKSDSQKVPKEGEAKGDGVINMKKCNQVRRLDRGKRRQPTCTWWFPCLVVSAYYRPSQNAFCTSVNTSLIY